MNSFNWMSKTHVCSHQRPVFRIWLQICCHFHRCDPIGSGVFDTPKRHDEVRIGKIQTLSDGSCIDYDKSRASAADAEGQRKSAYDSQNWVQKGTKSSSARRKFPRENFGYQLALSDSDLPEESTVSGSILQSHFCKIRQAQDADSGPCCYLLQPYLSIAG